MLWLKCSFQHLDMRRSPVRRNVVQHFTFVFSPCRLGFRPPDLTGFGLLPREGKRDLPELDLHSLPVFKALTAFLLPQKRLHNCKEPEQFVCFSFSKLPTFSQLLSIAWCVSPRTGFDREPALHTQTDGEFNKEIPHKSGFIQHYSNRCVEPRQIILKKRIKRVSKNPDVLRQTS